MAAIARDNLTMRTLAVIFVLALITIAFEIYSDAALTSAEVSQTRLGAKVVREGLAITQTANCPQSS